MGVGRKSSWVRELKENESESNAVGMKDEETFQKKTVEGIRKNGPDRPGGAWWGRSAGKRLFLLNSHTRSGQIGSNKRKITSHVRKETKESQGKVQGPRC